LEAIDLPIEIASINHKRAIANAHDVKFFIFSNVKLGIAKLGSFHGISATNFTQFCSQFNKYAIIHQSTSATSKLGILGKYFLRKAETIKVEIQIINI
jgi:hypothetical protein